MSSDLRGARRHSREVALQVLFAMDLHAKKTGEQPAAQEAFDDVGSNFEMPESNRAFAKELVCGVAEHVLAQCLAPGSGTGQELWRRELRRGIAWLEKGRCQGQ